MSGAEEAQPEQAAAAMEQEAAIQAGSKRKAEEEAAEEGAGGEGDAQPPAKAQKTEAGQEAMAKAAPAPVVLAEPVTIGYKTFTTSKAAYDYFHSLIVNLRKYQNLNDYEFHMVRELIAKGHPDAKRKLEGGVRAIQIREVEIGSAITSCFFLVHDDGSDEDVSYRKCLARLFEELKDLASSNTGGGSQRARGGRGGGGRGRGGGGRGGGGRGGRGRGRHGRGGR